MIQPMKWCIVLTFMFCMIIYCLSYSSRLIVAQKTYSSPYLSPSSVKMNEIVENIISHPKVGLVCLFIIFIVLVSINKSGTLAASAPMVSSKKCKTTKVD
jgi:preprotein translocase subunit SecG